MKRTLLVCLSGLLGATLTHAAVVVFSDNFTGNGNLDGRNPTVGGAWNVTSGSIFTSGGVADIPQVGDVEAYASLSQALGAGQTMTVNYTTVVPSGNFVDWAGLSLYVSGVERIFTGLPGSSAVWGIDKLATDYTTQGGAAQVVELTYAYDTGAWSLDVGGQSLNGVGASGYAVDQLRIAAGNGASIAFTDIDVQFDGGGSAVPEPSTVALMGIAALCLYGVRRWREARTHYA